MQTTGDVAPRRASSLVVALGSAPMIAVVTGASSGIGREIALLLAQAGYRVVGVARWMSAQPYPAVEAFYLDLAQPSRVAGAGAEIGPVDVLVHCAGTGAYRAFLEQDQDEFDRIMQVNYLSVVTLTRALLPGMVCSSAPRRHVLFVSSMSARYGAWGHAGYAASKGAMRSFAESLRLELRPTGVGCTVVYPGIVDTPYFEKGSMRRLWPRVRRRAVSPQRVARAAVGAIGSRRSTVYVPRLYRTLDAVYAMSPRLAGWMVLRGSRDGEAGAPRPAGQYPPATPHQAPEPGHGK